MLQNISFNCPFDSREFSTTDLLLSYCSCHFNWRQFTADAYAGYGIKKPLELASANITPKREAEFIAGRYCASSAIMKMYPNREITIGIRPDRSPHWPQDIVGSISHSHSQNPKQKQNQSMAMAVIGSADSFYGLGIDCEELLSDQAALEISDLLLNPRELRLLAGLQQQWGFLVTLLFSAKESLFKALSSQVSTINSFHDFSLQNLGSHSLTLRPTKRLNNSWSTDSRFRIDYSKRAGHVVTMAVIPKS